jgi:phenylpyruvate tautomerase PptA (4-oxalocrotonate tautomerase family)
MPYLSIQTNVRIAEADESNLLKAASKLVASQLGKPEEYVMVSIAAGQLLIFAGSSEPAAFLELRSIGLPVGKRASLCTELTRLVTGSCSITPDRVFLVLVDVEKSLWAQGGKTFG